MANTHPFLQDGRVFAHNGVVQGIPQLETRLAHLGAIGLVHGDTDSERIFALITAETRRNDADVTAGLIAAVDWIATHLPVYALNLVLASASDLWALRYPATNELYVLDRPAGGTGTTRGLDAASSRIRARSEHLSIRRSLIIASEPMDADPGWRLLDPGELLHVTADLTARSSTPFPPVPAHPLGLSDLDVHSAASQQRGIPTIG